MDDQDLLKRAIRGAEIAEQAATRPKLREINANEMGTLLAGYSAAMILLGNLIAKEMMTDASDDPISSPSKPSSAG